MQKPRGSTVSEIEVVRIGKASLLNCDCMEYLATLPDKAFDLACVDPPYGINAGNMQMGKGGNKQWGIGKTWDLTPPKDAFFSELNRVSERQIIWGGNYFKLPITGGWIFWDKEKGKDLSFADGELAWTNFLNVLKKAPIRYDGFIGADVVRIHKTQKPIKLYEWLLTNYAKPGDRILDTHLGSMSSVIACENLGFEITGCELDKEYFDAGCQRVMDSQRQAPMFEAAPVQQIQNALI